MVERINSAEFKHRLQKQDVSAKRHWAFVCPICSTVQSVASLVAAGASPEEAAHLIGFCCEGRFTNAGPWPMACDITPIAFARRKVRGCDWTLGGLFKIHTLEVISPEGDTSPWFSIATGQAARELESLMETNGVRAGDAA